MTTYSYSDLADNILAALDIDLDKYASENQIENIWDSPSDQADACIAEIERLQRIEKAAKYAFQVYADPKETDRLIARLRVILDVKAE